MGRSPPSGALVAGGSAAPLYPTQSMPYDRITQTRVKNTRGTTSLVFRGGKKWKGRGEGGDGVFLSGYRL